MCKYGLLYLVASAIAILRVQLRFVDCINKRKKTTKLSFAKLSFPLLLSSDFTVPYLNYEIISPFMC